MSSWAATIEPPALTPAVVRILVAALYAIDLDYLRSHPRTPLLYRSGVFYQAEPTRGVGADRPEQWLSVPQVLAAGHGDCEDLACWLAAENTIRGMPSRPDVRSSSRAGRRTFHIVVRRADGTIEDPSARLGM